MLRVVCGPPGRNGCKPQVENRWFILFIAVNPEMSTYQTFWTFTKTIARNCQPKLSHFWGWMCWVLITCRKNW